MGSVFLADVNDYISPSQACVNPLFSTADPTKPEKSTPSLLRKPKPTSVIRRRPRQPILTLNENESEALGNSLTPQTASLPVKATISVADCLACSGCVTTAETVLVSQHSLDRLRQIHSQLISATKNGNQKPIPRVIFTISRASFVDLARILLSDENQEGKQYPDLFLKLASFLHRHFKANLLVDGNIPLEWSLIESAKEFCHRYRFVIDEAECCSRTRESANHLSSAPMELDPCIPFSTPSIAVSATETRFIFPASTWNEGSSSSSQEIVTVQHPPGFDSRFQFLTQLGPFESHDMLDSYALPMLSSSCPAFVCYIEKTVHDLVPNLCTVKSPMAMAGTLVKHGTYVSAADIKMKDDRIIHVAIMPCHDKKLEASRLDLAFYGEDRKIVSDVDLVITTGELFEALSHACVEEENDSANITEKIRKHLDQYDLAPCKTKNPEEMMKLEFNTACTAVLSSSMSGGTSFNIPTIAESRLWTGSGGYAEYLFRYAARELFQYEIPPSHPLPWKRAAFIHSVRRARKIPNGEKSSRHLQKDEDADVSTSDICEVSLYRLAGGMYSLHPLVENEAEITRCEPVLKFAIAYGFKNIQMLLQKISKDGSRGKACPYHYIEIMACPSGCLNGGGQVRGIINRAQKEISDNIVEDTKGPIHRIQTKETPTETRERVQRNQSIMNRVWPYQLQNHDFTKSVNAGILQMLHTRHHVVPKLELTTGATAGVSLDDTKW